VRLVKQGEGFGIDRIALTLQASVPGIGAEQFQQIAQRAKADCPLSKALASVPEITLVATLRVLTATAAAERIDDGSSRRSRRAAAHAQGRALQRRWPRQSSR
jgi:hypothetical protein